LALVKPFLYERLIAPPKLKSAKGKKELDNAANCGIIAGLLINATAFL
jgi:hypothetical protein